jgi:hypothetical protein
VRLRPMVSARRSKKMHCFINGAAITRMRILAIAAVALFCSAAAATPPLVTFVSPCSCHNVHGKGRWSVKHDPSTPPTDASAIQAVTPSNMFSWPSLDVPLTMQSERTGIEKPRGLFGLSVISVVPYGLFPYANSRRWKLAVFVDEL